MNMTMNSVLLLPFLLMCAIALCECTDHDEYVLESKIAVSRPNPRRDSRLVVNVNKYFDDLIGLLQHFVLNNDLDPMELPDLKEGFRIGLLLLAVTGKLWLTDGDLRSLSTLQRDGDVTLTYRKKQIDLHFVVGFEDDLIMNYDYKAKLMGLGPKGAIIGTIKGLAIQVDLVFDTETKVASLSDLKIIHSGKLDIKFTGTILVDLVSNILSDVITTLFTGVIMQVIEDKLRDVITDALANIHLIS